MNTANSSLRVFSLLFYLTLLFYFHSQALAQKRKAPAGGRAAIVVDERLSALRNDPALDARLLHRLSRGRFVAITGETRSRNGIAFYRVIVTRRTRGWIQREALVSPAHASEDERLLRLIEASDDFDRIARARIFLDTFRSSRLRPGVLLLFGDAAEAAAAKLSRDAARRLSEAEMTAGGAPQFSYFLNYNGLDRYNRQGIRFVFDGQQRSFHYDGASWREIVRKYPHTHEAQEARKKLALIAPFARANLSRAVGPP
jgi:hypothetical protein